MMDTQKIVTYQNQKPTEALGPWNLLPRDTVHTSDQRASSHPTHSYHQAPTVCQAHH